MLLFGGISVPVAARLPGIFTRERVERPSLKRLIKAVEVAGLLVLVTLVVVSLAGLVRGPGGRSMQAMKAAAASLKATEPRSGSASASNI